MGFLRSWWYVARRHNEVFQSANEKIGFSALQVKLEDHRNHIGVLLDLSQD